MIRVEAETKGLEMFLTAYVERIGNLDEFLNEAGQYMIGTIRQNFIKGGRPNMWEDLTDGQPSFLKISGGLFNSIQVVEKTANSVSVGSGDNPKKVRGLQFGFSMAGTPARYAAIFSKLRQLGRYEEDYVGWGGSVIINLPREFIMWQTENNQDQNNLVKLLIKHLNKGKK